MPVPEHLNHLLTQIGPQMDLDEVIAHHEDHLWLLQGGDDVLIEIIWVEERETLVFSAIIGSVPEENLAILMPLLLNYNYAWEATGGARMALDPNDREVVLLLDSPAASMDLPMMQAILGNLLEIVPQWRNTFQAPSESLANVSLDPLEIPLGSIRV
ncbi:type III secretion system chaperone [Prosthecobacter dejongeii]|uniref:Tir chaperone protein (CesT) family protein n=1 Tax=Prosthecobacter dejongeii TaxID=48465 RepID=A0A7W8DPI2_9BACT|nr:type III secretion system chaperone [Prosthecobacter dejongeii]MBB5037699.1 hypothetical protein [Prosthecobacter dejongeii]